MSVPIWSTHFLYCTEVNGSTMCCCSMGHLMTALIACLLNTDMWLMHRNENSIKLLLHVLVWYLSLAYNPHKFSFTQGNNRNYFARGIWLFPFIFKGSFKFYCELMIWLYLHNIINMYLYSGGCSERAGVIAPCCAPSSQSPPLGSPDPNTFGSPSWSHLSWLWPHQRTVAYPSDPSLCFTWTLHKGTLWQWSL